MEHIEGRVASGWSAARGVEGVEGGEGATHEGAAHEGAAVDGRSAVWARCPELAPGTASLAVFGDYVPFGVRQALGEGFSSHSLDNTLRVLRPAGAAAAGGGGWVLADVAIRGTSGGFGYGEVHLWDERGALLATASQSFVRRRRV